MYVYTPTTPCSLTNTKPSSDGFFRCLMVSKYEYMGTPKFGYKIVHSQHWKID